MILGVGTDIVDIAAFQEQLDDPASSFVSHTFTPQERQDCISRTTRPARHFAARYAAKEAFIKAWSSSRWGLPPVVSSVSLLDIEVCSDAWRCPKLVLHGELAHIFSSFPHAIHVSLSHDGPSALAFVVLEASSHPSFSPLIK